MAIKKRPSSKAALKSKSSKRKKPKVEEEDVKSKKKKPKKSKDKSAKSRKDSKSPKRSRGSKDSPFGGARKEKARRDKERETRNNKPFDFYIKDGEKAKYYILDDGEPYTGYEHSRYNPNLRKGARQQDPVPCIKERDICPACEADGKEGYWFMAVTVVVVSATGMDSKYKYRKKLMKIKSGSAPKFERLYAKKGSFRGMMLEVARDGDKSPSIGNDIDFVEFLSEAKMKKLAAKYNVKDKKGNVVSDITKATDYKKAFPKLSRKELEKLYGRTSGGALGEEDFGDDEDDDDYALDLDD